MKPQSKHPRVLVCPLDWGLGHATRCVPLIREFLAQGAEVILGTTGLQVAYFQQEFPHLKQIDCPSYKILYPEHGWMMPFWLLRETPRLRKVIATEHQWAEEQCAKHHIDLIISDNRFGCYSTKVPSIYMTHQVRIPFAAPFRRFEILGQKLHAKLQAPFSKVWIPDLEGSQNLAGRLSHSGIIPWKHQFIGPLSRFAPRSETCPKQNAVIAMLSGPEPQRTLLEEKVLQALKHIPGKKILVQGRPGHESRIHDMPNLDIHSHLDSETLRTLILESEFVLCRSGYSTLMDLQALGAKAVLIPTPGQTEQETLALDLKQRGFCGALNQDKLSAEHILLEVKHAHGFSVPENTHPLVVQAVKQALQSLAS